MELDKGLGGWFLRSGHPISSFIFPDGQRIHRGGQTGLSEMRTPRTARPHARRWEERRTTTWGPYVGREVSPVAAIGRSLCHGVYPCRSFPRRPPMNATKVYTKPGDGRHKICRR